MAESLRYKHEHHAFGQMCCTYAQVLFTEGVVKSRVTDLSPAPYCTDPPGALRGPLRGASREANLHRRQWALRPTAYLP